jgi:hypothetical protein
MLYYKYDINFLKEAVTMFRPYSLFQRPEILYLAYRIHLRIS